MKCRKYRGKPASEQWNPDGLMDTKGATRQPSPGAFADRIPIAIPQEDRGRQATGTGSVDVQMPKEEQDTAQPKTRLQAQVRGMKLSAKDVEKYGATVRCQARTEAMMGKNKGSPSSNLSPHTHGRMQGDKSRSTRCGSSRRRGGWPKTKKLRPSARAGRGTTQRRRSGH